MLCKDLSHLKNSSQNIIHLSAFHCMILKFQYQSKKLLLGILFFYCFVIKFVSGLKGSFVNFPNNLHVVTIFLKKKSDA